MAHEREAATVSRFYGRAAITFYCTGKDKYGRCVPGKYKRPPKPEKDTYHLSNALWAELEQL